MCTSRSLYEAMVFLLGNVKIVVIMMIIWTTYATIIFIIIYYYIDRMGNPKEALRLIVSKLNDVDQVSNYLMWYEL